LNKLLSCSAFIVSETVCSDVLVFSAITRYVIINSFSLLIFSIMNIATLIFWFPIISRLSNMLPSHILFILVSCFSFFFYFFFFIYIFYNELCISYFFVSYHIKAF